MRWCGWLFWLLLALAWPGRAADLAAGWAALADYRAEEALRIFTAAAKAADPAVVRLAELGRGVTLLALQPVSQAQIEQARSILSALTENQADEAALGAWFYLARIAQHHRAQAEPAEAARCYRRLLELAPDSAWAQSALGRLALLELYAPDGRGTLEQRFARVSDLLGLARTPEARCDLHWLMAEAVAFHRLPEARALPHLIAAEETGRLDVVTRPDVLVQIAELARRTGEAASAREYYLRFLRDYPRDNRDYLVRQRLAALDAAPVAPVAEPAMLAP